MAHFKTAYGQREIILDAKVAAMSGNNTGHIKVGDLVTLTTDNYGVHTITEVAALTNATHIVAQSDMTLEYGHVPVENRDWKYVPNVAVSTTVKKVALFQIIDKNDVIV